MGSVSKNAKPVVQDHRPGPFLVAGAERHRGAIHPDFRDDGFTGKNRLGKAHIELADTFGSSGRPALAPRERQLVRFVRQGLRNREIAKQLGVTEGTVKVYLHAVFDKLGVSNRTELAIRADEFLAESYVKK